MERPENTKTPHEKVGYQRESKHRGETCSRCLHFIDEDPARCETVASPIEPEGWCERFELDPARLTHAEYRKFREEGGGKEMDEDSVQMARYRDMRESGEGEYGEE